MLRYIIILSLTLPFLFSCKQSENKKLQSKAIIAEWVGKGIKFPQNIECFKIDSTIQCPEINRENFKILLYVDSVGCTSCRTKLMEWKILINQSDTIFENKPDFLYFFQIKSNGIRELKMVLRNNRFDYPVFVDKENAIMRLNNFPKETQYQCFLLDKNNKVLAIGNPVLNPKIWELYKSQIAGGKQTEPEILTTVKADKTVYDYGTIRKGSVNPATFTITNTGNHPLIISRVSASCGCTNVSWDKQPVESGKTAIIRVEMKPEETGRFSKTIELLCNVKESPVKLTLEGITE